MLTKIQPGMIENGAVGLAALNASGSPTADTFLSGAMTWTTNPALVGLDFGQINAALDNVILLLVQASPIDFNNLTLGYDAGTI